MKRIIVAFITLAAIAGIAAILRPVYAPVEVRPATSTTAAARTSSVAHGL